MNRNRKKKCNNRAATLIKRLGNWPLVWRKATFKGVSVTDTNMCAGTPPPQCIRSLKCSTIGITHFRITS